MKQGLTKKHIKDRSKGLGGSDIAAILGESQYKTPMDVFCEKRGYVKKIQTPQMLWGIYAEPALAKIYSDKFKVRFTGNKSLFLRSEKNDWIVGSPDRLIVAPQKGLDLKTARIVKAKQWGEEDTDEVPDEYYLQMQWYMQEELTNLKEFDLFVSIAGAWPKRYTVHRDDQLIRMMIEAGQQFWFDHILKDNPPPLDGHKSSEEYLKSRYPSARIELTPATPEQTELVGQYRIAKEALEKAEAEAERLKHEIQSEVGERKGLIGDFGKVTWLNTKDSTEIDWTGACLEMQPSQELIDKHRILVDWEELGKELNPTPEVLARHQRIVRKGGRRLLTQFNE